MPVHNLHNNIYSLALTYGAAHPDGVTYNEVRAMLESNGYVKWDARVEDYFKHWFFFNFENGDATILSRKWAMGQGGMRPDAVNLFLDRKAVITGDAFMNHIEIQDLVEAKAAARRAQTTANLAFGVSIVTAVASIALTGMQIWLDHFATR